MLFYLIFAIVFFLVQGACILALESKDNFLSSLIEAYTTPFDVDSRKILWWYVSFSWAVWPLTTIFIIVAITYIVRDAIEDAI